MNYNEMKQAVKLLSKEWNLGKKEAGADIALIILTLSIWTMGFLLKDIENFEE